MLAPLRKALEDGFRQINASASRQVLEARALRAAAAAADPLPPMRGMMFGSGN